MINIDNLTDSRVASFSNLKKNKSLLSKNLIICESEKVIKKIIQKKITIKEVFTTIDLYNKYFLNLNIDKSKIYIAKKNLIQNIIGHKLHNFLFVICEKPRDYLLEQLDDYIIILNKISSPENIGSIIRNAAGFSFKSLIYDKLSCSPYMRRSVRVSMGNVFDIKTHLSNNLCLTINYLQKNGYQIYATANENNAIDISKIKKSKKLAVIFGSEGFGIDNEIKNITDLTIKIPIDQNVGHLNVSSASAIILHQLKLLNF